jgi:hypothetical protein
MAVGTLHSPIRLAKESALAVVVARTLRAAVRLMSRKTVANACRLPAIR